MKIVQSVMVGDFFTYKKMFEAYFQTIWVIIFHLNLVWALKSTANIFDSPLRTEQNIWIRDIVRRKPLWGHSI